MDYRLLENRKSAFIRWYGWQLLNGDCDPAIWLTNYLFDRFEHNIEQKYWIAWIYGTTYHLPTTWIIWNEFPDFELVDLDRITEWNSKNYHRLRYQTDTKYNKGYLPQQFKSYHNWIHHNNDLGSQEHRFNQLTVANSFDNVWNSITKNLFKFGRYTTWFYMQTLYDCVGVNVVPKDLKLSDVSGSKSHRNGLCFALGKDEWVDKKLNKDTIAYLEYEALLIQKEVSETYKVRTSAYTMETALCSFKKIFRKHDSRYLGYYLDRQAEEILKVMEDDWFGIDWQVFWDGRNETLHPKLSESKRIKKELYGEFLDRGDFWIEL